MKAILCLSVILTLGCSLSAADRVALVIGNNHYTNLPANSQLTSPVSDATDVAAALKSLGYTIVTGGPVTDPGKDAFVTATEDFAAQAKGASLAVFYYSGHGVQVGDDNYLLPSDSPKLSGLSVLKNRAVMLRDSVMVALEEAGVKSKVIILDCCRDNPFSTELDGALAAVGKSIKSKDVGEITGYGPGFYLAFATSPGSIADDGNGQRNSPFTAAILSLLPDAERKDIDFFFREVKASLGDAQVSWTSHSLRDSFSLLTGKVLPPKMLSEAEVQRRVKVEVARLQAVVAGLASGLGNEAQKSAKPSTDTGATESRVHRVAMNLEILAVSPELRKMNRELSENLVKELDNLVLEVEGLQRGTQEIGKEITQLVAELKARKVPDLVLARYDVPGPDPKGVEVDAQDFDRAKNEIRILTENAQSTNGLMDLEALVSRLTERKKQRDGAKVELEARLATVDKLKELLDRTPVSTSKSR